MNTGNHTKSSAMMLIGIIIVIVLQCTTIILMVYRRPKIMWNIMSGAKTPKHEHGDAPNTTAIKQLACKLEVEPYVIIRELIPLGIFCNADMVIPNDVAVLIEQRILKSRAAHGNKDANGEGAQSGG